MLYNESIIKFNLLLYRYQIIISVITDFFFTTKTRLFFPVSKYRQNYVVWIKQIFLPKWWQDQEQKRKDSEQGAIFIDGRAHKKKMWKQSYEIWRLEVKSDNFR